MCPIVLQIKCEGMVVTGQAETKVIEGLTNLHADAVIIGTHDRNTLSRYASIYSLQPTEIMICK